MNSFKPATKAAVITGEAKTADTYNNTLLDKARRDFPQIDELLNLVLKDQLTAPGNTNHFVTAAMQIIINQINNCGLKPPLRDLYIGYKKYELLLLICNEAIHEDKDNVIRLSDYDIKCLHEVRSIIMDNLDRPYTLPELAHKAGINECKLKKGFKQVFGTPVYRFLRNERMKRSLLLLENDAMSIEDIALELGFPNTSAFTNAFCNTFGYPPTFIRKQQRM